MKETDKSFKKQGRKKKTTEEFKKEVYAVWGDEYTVVGEYLGSQIPVAIRHNCEDCNYAVNEMFPASILRGSRCFDCNGTKKKTTEEYKKEIYDVWGDEYTVLGEYKTKRTKILVRHNCELCNNKEWYTRPDVLRRGNGCPICWALATRMSKEEIESRMLKLYEKDEYTFLTEITTDRVPIEVRHNSENCNNHTWSTTLHSIINGHGCPKCARLKSQEDYKKELYLKHSGVFKLIGRYEGSDKEVLIKHDIKECGLTFTTTANNMISHGSCPYCSSSLGEQKIYNYLKGSGIKFKQEVGLVKNSKTNKNLRYDFGIYNSLNELKGLIEFDGKQHYEFIPYIHKTMTRFKNAQERDAIKDNWCIENKIPLLRIKYTDYDIVEELVKKFTDGLLMDD